MADDLLPADRESRLDEVLASYLEAVEAGAPPDRRDLLERHPDLAEDLAAFFKDQDQFDSLVAPLRTPAPGSASSARATVLPATSPPGKATTRNFTVRYVGDYELLEEVARGGMGVVYKARQLTLNRTVALKMILAGELALPEEVQRFRLEAEAAANLDHPNIVPIYEVGTHEGQPYFSMKLVDGGNLSQHRSRLADRPREAARLLAAVARAVHYAHQRGLLHRDLKPANILLNVGQAFQPDSSHVRLESLTYAPMITDFGLAKRVAVQGRPGGEAGGNGPSAASLTHSGTTVGTPSYMAPEQASGRKGALTTAADVYSLGAILYELLTGRPPFKADTPLNTLLEVLHREPVPPRTLRPGVDRDLETICLKCLQKEPGKRYATASALADDLERFLKGEPIQARPVGPLGRAGRWCRRNPALAAAAGLAGAALAAVVVVSCLYAVAESRHAARLAGEEVQLQQALDAAQRNAQEAQQRAAEVERERARAEESFRQAHQAVNDITRLSEGLAQLPGGQPLRKRVLATALKYYQNFLDQRGDDPRLRAELADAYSRAGFINDATGAKTDALAAYQRALDLYQDLARAHPEDLRWQGELVRMLNNVGVLQDTLGQPAAAQESVRQALALCERRVREHPDAPDVLRELASVYHHLGSQDRDAGRFDQSFAHFRDARSLYEQLVCADPRSRSLQGELALCINNIGVMYGQVDQLHEALRCFEEARALRERLADDKDRGSQLALAASYRDTGLTYHRLGRRDDALGFYQKAHDIRKRLADQNPQVSSYQGDLADSLTDLGAIHMAKGDLKDALDCFKGALKIHEQLVRVDPNVAGRQNDLARSHTHCGEVLSAAGQHQDALRAFGRAREIEERLVKANPERYEFRHDLARALDLSGLTLGKLDRHDEALAALREAVEQERVALARAPAVARYGRALNGHYGTLGEVARAAGRPEESAAALLEQRRLCQDQPQELYRIAAELVLTARVVGRGKAEPSPEEQAQRRRYDDLAVETLRQALARGYHDLNRLRTDPGLAELRGRDDFQGLLAGAQD
jgi:serine/threonine protein kinase